MKNKSKLQKINKQKSNPSFPSHWLYLNQGNISVRVLEEALSATEGITTERWDDMGILEIEIPDAKSIDFEQGEPELHDDYGNAFLKEHSILSLYYVTADPENEDTVRQIFRQIVSAQGGFFCGDTEDFSPIIDG